MEAFLYDWFLHNNFLSVSVVRQAYIIRCFCCFGFFFFASVWMWCLWLLKWFTGSVTLCRNFLLVCRFCIVCLHRRVFYLLSFSLARSLPLVFFHSSGIHFIPTPHSYTVCTLLIYCEYSRSFAFIAPQKEMLLRANM